MPNQFTVRPVSLGQRFWSKVSKSEGGCWVWTGSRGAAGYGVLWSSETKTNSLYAHRVSYELHFGPIPRGLLVCHRCDNPACVRPDHLFLGTDQDNMLDRDRKGRCPQGANHYARRTPEKIVRGERRHTARLTEGQVREIRERRRATGIGERELAEEYGVARTTIADILHRRTWTHI